MGKHSFLIDISIIIIVSILLVLVLSYILYVMASYKVLFNYFVIIASTVFFVVWRIIKFLRMKSNNVSNQKALYVSFIKPLVVLVIFSVSVVILVVVLLVTSIS